MPYPDNMNWSAYDRAQGRDDDAEEADNDYMDWTDEEMGAIATSVTQPVSLNIMDALSTILRVPNQAMAHVTTGQLIREAGEV
jgi:hypothetical protein